MNGPTPETSTILIVGLARNCGNRITKTLKRLVESASAFKTAHFLIIESDSTDTTVSELEKAQSAMPNFRYIALGDLRIKYPLRTDRIAFCRNAYIDQLASHSSYSDVSYILVCDMDGVSRSLSTRNITSCWHPSAPRWDVCTANQGDFYYDIWALRHPIWCPGDAWKEHDLLAPVVGEIAAKEISIYSRMIHIPAERPMIEVDSAFGGLAIYRRSAFVAGRYRGIDDSGREICEHVVFHSALRKKGFRIFINPRMISARTTENAKAKSPLQQFRRLVRDCLKL
ncbi:hypothetical protein [Horticoccus sp. 23ND18S-11]|uniref:hypothetical protein n=1 Tax=Horticoccus sp. 23ND18S-11 TaxID=3391832 RepID=UPI0039C96D10